MTNAYVDANILIRLFSHDDPRKADAVERLFEEVREGKVIVTAPVTVIADVAFVLTSPRTYGMTRDQVAEALIDLLALPGFQVPEKATVVRALEMFGTGRLRFDDAFIAASMETAGIRRLYTYDADFDRLPNVERIEPPPP
jgi:predicted nucleic acid-binding protein